MRRRHLSTIDLTLLALLIKPKFEKAAAERKAATQPKPGEQGARTRPQDVAAVPPLNNQDLIGKSRDLAAKTVGVSGRRVENVALITKHAPALIPDIKAGLITIPQAVDRVRGQEDLKRQQEATAPRARAVDKAVDKSGDLNFICMSFHWRDKNKPSDVTYFVTRA